MRSGYLLVTLLGFSIIFMSGIVPAAETTNYTETVRQMFKEEIKRELTQEEIDHFSAALKAKQVDAAGLRTFLRTLPPDVLAKDKEYRNSIAAPDSGPDALLKANESKVNKWLGNRPKGLMTTDEMRVVIGELKMQMDYAVDQTQKGLRPPKSDFDTYRDEMDMLAKYPHSLFYSTKVLAAANRIIYMLTVERALSAKSGESDTLTKLATLRNKLTWHVQTLAMVADTH